MLERPRWRKSILICNYMDICLAVLESSFPEEEAQFTEEL